jgi:hypothetical protein
VREGRPSGCSFPFIEQIFRIDRVREDLRGERLSSETVYGVTSLDQRRASPKRLLDLSRGHWSIENKSHWVRDVTFAEDHSRIRKGFGAHVMATLRNLVIGLLRLAGFRNIAAGLRELMNGKRRQVLRVIGIL